MEDCIFCQIVAGKIPAAKIYEDDSSMAFMDISPVNPGACLVIPKQHTDRFTDLPDELASHLLIKAQTIARKVQKVFKPIRVGYTVHGFGVHHAHLNIVPMHRADDISAAKFAVIKDGKVVIDESSIPTLSLEEREKQAAQLRD